MVCGSQTIRLFSTFYCTQQSVLHKICTILCSTASLLHKIKEWNLMPYSITYYFVAPKKPAIAVNFSDDGQPSLF